MAAINIIMGPTGAGKSVQCRRLAAELGWVHLSTGEILRQDPKMSAVLASGALAPSGEVERVLAEAIQQVDDEKVIALDGFPRMLDEADWLEENLASWQRTIGKVVYINVPLAVSQERLNLRGRSDDTPDATAEKWKEFETRTVPVLNYYYNCHQLASIDGIGTEQEVYSRIKKVFNV